MCPVTLKFVLIDVNRTNGDCQRLEEDQLINISPPTHKCQLIIPNFLTKFHYGETTVCLCFQRHFVASCGSALETKLASLEGKPCLTSQLQQYIPESVRQKEARW